MKPSARHLRRPLDQLFSAPSHLAVLRALEDVREGMGGRELARLAGVSHQAGRLAVARLEGLGVVRHTGAGKARRFFLNEEDETVRIALLPVLAAEKRLIEKALRREHTAFLVRARAIMGKG